LDIERLLKQGFQYPKQLLVYPCSSFFICGNLWLKIRKGEKMSYPLSANVSAGDPTLSAHYNNLRSDALHQQAAADVVMAALLERYESRLTLERLSTYTLRVPASATEPVSIVVAGCMLQATANVDLSDAGKPAGAADDYYIFANRVAGSTTFTLSVNTSITEAANQRLWALLLERNCDRQGFC
jgi:hypothetical protein